MTNDFVQNLKERILFTYYCFDRVIIKGYIMNLFGMGGVVVLLRSLGFRSFSNGVLRILTDQLNAHIAKSAKKENIPVHWWPAVDGGKNGDKLRFVEKYYKNSYKGNGNHVYCILTGREKTTSVASREITGKSLRPFQRLYKVNKQVKHYYIYLHDCVLGGPCYLKISSYLPFHCEFYFNGHNHIKLNLDKQGIGYRTNGNAFTQTDDASMINAFAGQLTGRVVSQRINYWMGRFFKFDKGTYSTCSKYLKHNWYNSQVEVCSNVVFKSARWCRSLFERLLDKYARIGSPDYLSRIFEIRQTGGTQSRSNKRIYPTMTVVQHWIRGNAIKIYTSPQLVCKSAARKSYECAAFFEQTSCVLEYNKLCYFIRSETTINNPKLPGHIKLKKPVTYLQAYLWAGLKANERYLDVCADVDVSSLYNEGAHKYRQSVFDAKGRKVAAPDLRKERQQALIAELSKPCYRSHAFRSKELLSRLGRYFRNPARIRYEMRK